MRILGIESSCDETAAAVVELSGERGQERLNLVSNVVASSLDLHVQYGGVVPEIAARSHIEVIIPVVDEAVRTAAGAMPGPVAGAAPGPESGVSVPAGSPADPWDAIDAIAVTYGAGLGGSLMVGVMTARSLAIAKQKPLYGINHVEGHVYANFITTTPLPGFILPPEPPRFPLLALIVSGGHSQLVLFRDHFDYDLLGQTQDDAIGEAFDKVAKLLGLPYPGGPSVGAAAQDGNAEAYDFPKAKMSGRYDFSFSGLKTAVLRTAQATVGADYTLPSWQVAGKLTGRQVHDLAASFQRVAIETVVDKTVQAYQEFQPASVVIAGGVAASPELRRQLKVRLPCPIAYTDPKLCTDNGAMIAALGAYTHAHGRPQADPLSLGIAPALSM